MAKGGIAWTKKEILDLASSQSKYEEYVGGSKPGEMDGKCRHGERMNGATCILCAAENMQARLYEAKRLLAEDWEEDTLGKIEKLFRLVISVGDILTWLPLEIATWKNVAATLANEKYRVMQRLDRSEEDRLYYQGILKEIIAKSKDRDIADFASYALNGILDFKKHEKQEECDCEDPDCC